MPFVKSKCPLPTRSLRLLRAAVRSTSSALCLHYACKRSHPFVQDSGFVSHVERHRFGHGVVVSKVCYGILERGVLPFAMLLQWVEIELLATVGWKCGFQPFSCPCRKTCHCRTAERRFFRHACLRIPCLLWNISPLPTRSLRSLRAAAHSTSSALWLHHAHAFVAVAEQTSRIQRSRGFGHGVVVSRTCSGVFRSPIVPCDHCKTLNGFGDWAFIHGGWWGCQPFSCPCSPNVTVGEKKIAVLRACWD